MDMTQSWASKGYQEKSIKQWEVILYSIVVEMYPDYVKKSLINLGNHPN